MGSAQVNVGDRQNVDKFLPGLQGNFFLLFINEYGFILSYFEKKNNNNKQKYK